MRIVAVLVLERQQSWVDRSHSKALAFQIDGKCLASHRPVARLVELFFGDCVHMQVFEDVRSRVDERSVVPGQYSSSMVRPGTRYSCHLACAPSHCAKCSRNSSSVKSLQ